MSISVTQLKDQIVHDKDNTTRFAALDRDSLLGSAKTHVDKANGHMAAHGDDHFTIGGTSTESIEQRAEQLKARKEWLESLRKAAPGQNFDSLEKAITKDTETLQKDSVNFYKHMNKGGGFHATAITKAAERQAKLLTEIEKDYAAKIKTLGTTAKVPELEQLTANKNAAVEAVNNEFAEVNKLHTEAIEKIGKVSKDIEKHSGAKASDHLNFKSASAADKGPGFLNKIKGNWEHAKLRTGLGALLVAAPLMHLGYRVSTAGDVNPETNERKGVPLGVVAADLGVGALGVWAMVHGGKENFAKVGKGV